MVGEANAAIASILSQAVSHRKGAGRLKDILLANLVMVGEIPAETCKEEKRIRFVMDRFRECGLDKISTDEANNVLSVLPGREGGESILVCAHIDTLFDGAVDHNVKVSTESVEGAGIADNSLGVAVLCTLPTLLQELGVQLDADLILMGASQSLGRGNLRGIGFFLDHHPGDIKAGVCVEGVDLGRLSYQSIGMLRGEIVCRDAKAASEGHFAAGAIGALSEVVRWMERIPIPHRPRTTINLGAVHAGKSFHLPAARGGLKFEVRSEQSGFVETLQERLKEIVSQVAWENDVELELQVIARRRNGGIEFGHPLTAAARQVMERLKITPEVRPSVGELSSLISKNIPGITLGITERAPSPESREAVRIEPMFSGIAQLVAVLQAIDGGVCDVEGK